MQRNIHRKFVPISRYRRPIIEKASEIELDRHGIPVTDLRQAACLENVRRGVVRITKRGRSLLAENHPRITVKLLTRFPEFVEFHRRKSVADITQVPLPATDAGAEDSQTPQEALEANFQDLQSSLAEDLLDAVKKMSPERFEQLVVELLVAMGYGGSIPDAGKALGKAGDEGIDGVIKEDKLGLDSDLYPSQEMGSRSRQAVGAGICQKSRKAAGAQEPGRLHYITSRIKHFR
jgi:restriction system protein